MDYGPMRVAMMGSWWMVLMRMERSSASMEDLRMSKGLCGSIFELM